MTTGIWIDRYSQDCRLKYPSKATQDNYISQVKSFLFRFQNYQHPKAIPNAEIKEWFLQASSPNTRNHRQCAVNSFYTITLKMPNKVGNGNIPFARKAQSLPMPLSIEEVHALISKCKNKKHLAIISLLFGCGMRVGEVLSLMPSQIDRSRGVIHVINGKGLKDRFVPMDEHVLKILEDYYREYSPNKWMFNGQFSTPENPTQYTLSSINQFLKDIAKEAGITKRIHSHLGRHTYATALVETGTDLGIVQNILGHKRQSTTLIYAKVSAARIASVKSPIFGSN